MSDDPDEPMFPLPKMESVDYGPSWVVLGALFALAALLVVAGIVFAVAA